MFPSGYLIVITTVSICNNAVSREERGEGLTYKNLAILRPKTREKIKAAS